jgi:hypothetical protein
MSHYLQKPDVCSLKRGVPEKQYIQIHQESVPRIFSLLEFIETFSGEG